MTYNPNVAAFLRVIRQGETNQSDSAYRMMYGGRLFTSFANHPNTLNTAAGHSSTAAGAYQFLWGTWQGLVEQNHYTDFSPSTQDHAAVQLIKRRGAYEDVIAGNFEAAVLKCNKEWASLPGSPYGQPTMSMEDAKAVYENWGGSYHPVVEGEEVVVDSQSPAPISESIPTIVNKPKGKNMVPIFVQVALEALSVAIPAIAQIVGGAKDKRNAVVGQVVVDLAKQAVGAVNEQELIASLDKPEAVAAIKEAVRVNYFELTEAGGGGIVGAREASQKAAESPHNLFKNPAFIITLLLLPMTYVVLYAVLWGVDVPENLKVMVVTAVISGVLNGIMGYWIGTSMSSANKTDLLMRK